MIRAIMEVDDYIYRNNITDLQNLTQIIKTLFSSPDSIHDYDIIEPYYRVFSVDLDSINNIEEYMPDKSTSDSYYNF